MKSAALLLVLLALGPSCSGGAANDAANLKAGGVSDPALRASCRWPSDVQAAAEGAVAQGCGAWDAFTTCEVASDGSKSCSDTCGSARYAVGCYEASPSPAWACESIRIPTPAGWSYFCCPCQ